MKGQPHRLLSNARHFAGASIDRRQPVKFKLNGLTISGFEGDTVLSALLACGYDTAGQRDGHALALTKRHAPPIVALTHGSNPARALPMERTPVTQAAEYVILGAGRAMAIEAAVQNLWRSRSLGLNLDLPTTMQRPWIATAAETEPATDLIVVGGGVAGMSAALAGAKAGLKVTLLESSLRLGGNSRPFGTQDKEETPEESIARLSTAITQNEAITVMTGTEALAARPGAVRVHAVSLVNGAPSSSVQDLPTRHIVIATGVIERLPIFPGNRLPGICTPLEAYDLAYHFGVWPGKTAVFATIANAPYRLAMQASDAGVPVSRIMDGRVAPQSRFIEFSKAYGITMAAGTVVGEVQSAKKNGQLAVTAQLTFGNVAAADPPLTTDRLVVCGGWQPELTLWHMAGGESRWNPVVGRLEPILKGPKGVALAGSAAGYISRHACLLSGRDAVQQLLSRSRIVIEEKLIDPFYETPDDPTPVSSLVSGAAPAFLDAGQSYIERPEQESPRWPAWLPFIPRAPAWSLADMPSTLQIADIAAGTQLGAIPAESAGVVAQERVALIPIASAPAPAPTALLPQQHTEIPTYLSGRYGGDSVLWTIAPLEERRLEVGALVYSNADESDPYQAIGVVMRAAEQGATALMNALAAQPGLLLFVREDDRPVAIRLVGAHSPAVELGTAFSGGASAP